MAAVLEFYFRFRLWPFNCHRRMVLLRCRKFHWKTDCPRQIYVVIAIFKMAAVSYVVFGLGTVRAENQQNVTGGRCFVLTVPSDRICSFGDTVIVIFRRFGLKLPIHAHS